MVDMFSLPKLTISVKTDMRFLDTLLNQSIISLLYPEDLRILHMLIIELSIRYLYVI